MRICVFIRIAVGLEHAFYWARKRANLGAQPKGYTPRPRGGNEDSSLSWLLTILTPSRRYG
jgi:hypothetical protein